MRKLLGLLLLVLVVANATGCTAFRDRRDAPWDPTNGRSLFEQLPNWEHPMGTQPDYRPRGV